MSEKAFRYTVGLIAAVFALFFAVIVVPPLIENPDVIGAFASGFVNPYASGYSADVFCCWAVLAVWVVHEAKTLSIRHGWACLILGVVPGVAVGFGAYLILRSVQLETFSRA